MTRRALNVHHPHDDVIVIATQVANHMVFLMLIDNGSLMNILYASVYDAVGLNKGTLKPIKVPLNGFISETVFPK